MKRIAVLLAIVFASGASVKAGDMENLRNSSDSLLNQIEESIDGLTKARPKPQQHNTGHQGNVHQPKPPQHNPGHPGNGHHPPPQHNPGHNPGYNPGHNPGHGGHYPPPPPPPSPVYPPYNPGHPGWNPPYPPVYPPYPPAYPPYNPGHPGWNNDRVFFQSDRFEWSSDAERSLRDAVEALRDARILVLEQRRDYDRYTIVFESRRNVRVEKYHSSQYTWSSDAKRAAEETARSLRHRGMVILENNVKNYRFTISYFDPRW